MSSSSSVSPTRGYVFIIASLCVAVCSRWAVIVDGFNVDTSTPLVFHHSDIDSQFGLALTLHREGGQNMLLVGAPRADSSGYSQDMGIERSGALYKCPIDISLGVTNVETDCQEIVLDTTGNEYLNTMDPTFQSTNASSQWLGSVVQSGGSDGSVVVCRPLYQYQEFDAYEKVDRYLLGGCFVINGGLTSPNSGLLDTAVNFNPCAQPDQVGFRKRNRCEFGGSAAARDDRVVYGAPGSCLWNGRFWYTKGTISAGSAKFSFPQGACNYKLDFEYYFGHAVAFGNFRDGPSSSLEVAIGAPRWKHGFARVFLYDDSNTEYDQLYASDLATYFGHALAASDLNNDGYDDLVVSAPMFTDEERSIDAGWEVGKIFIYYNDQQGSFSIENVDTIIGTGAGCRFGYSLAALGDINGDGFNDLAVGAPFCEGGDNGKVFIYHGTGMNLPLNLSPQQTLSASEQGSTPLKFFGFVISGGYDIDQNDYPDFAVGAHESQTALIFRSRAVVSTIAEIDVEENQIDPEIKDMTTSNGISVTGFHVIVCFQYSGQGVPDNLNFTYDILLDSSRQSINRRAAFISNNMANLDDQIVSVSLEGRTCATHDAYIRPAIRDKQTPITLQLTHGLDATTQSSFAVQPIMSNRATTLSINSLVFARDCAGETCYPDLALQTNVSTTHLTIGNAETFLLTIDVMNSGEDAFLSVLDIIEPPGLFFVNVQHSNTGTIVSCSSSLTTNKRTCNIGNPLGAGDEITVGLQYQTATYSSFSGPAVLNLTARSTDAEKPGRDEDNFASVSIPVFASSSLVLSGNSIPDTLVITEDSNETDSVGPLMNHVIRLQNNGPSFIGPSTIEILWPIRLQDDTVLMNVTGVSTEAGMPCTLTPRINTDVLTENNVTTFEDEVNNATIYTLWADCNSLPECLMIQCPLSSLAVGTDAAIIVSVESILLPDAVFAKDFLHYIEIVSTASVTVNGTVYPGIPYSPHPTVSSLEIQTEIRVQYANQRIIIQNTPIWIYIVSSIVGFLILVIFIAILYKVKFFKRQQITEEQREILHDHRKSMRRSRMSAPDPDSPPPDDELGMEESPLQREGSVAGLIQE